MNQLQNLKKFTVIVADTSDIEMIKKYSPQDTTTNPTLIYKAAKEEKYKYLIDEAVNYSKKHFSFNKILSSSIDRLFINFAKEILKIIPNRLSIEIDARLSFNIKASVDKAKKLISLLEKEKIKKERILIKLAATWEGIAAAKILEKEGIHCNITLIFSLPQAIAAAEAKVTLISPFVGRILDWYLKNKPKKISSYKDPGVLSYTKIYNYFKKFEYKTEIMGASFRNKNQILALAGADLLTISPVFLEELKKSKNPVKKNLSTDNAKNKKNKKIKIDKKIFKSLLSKDIMASENLYEGIRKFSDDTINLESLLLEKIKK
ncbi:MAG: transaldolase [Chlamydiae bacterium SM23_39]|nr:MAG: transaldolase [Chlamydiae bacterium SM23_39]